MKKKSILVLLVLLPLLLFSGCDAVLETFFPEVTVGDGDGAGGDYSIRVTVEFGSSIWNTGFGGDDENGDPIAIKVAMIPFNETQDGFVIDENGMKEIGIRTLSEEDFRIDYDGQANKTYVDFNLWNNATYKVLVWVDQNNDETIVIDFDTGMADEPGALATRDNGDFWVDFRYWSPRNAGVNMRCWIESASEVNVNQLVANPYATYDQGTEDSPRPVAAIYSSSTGSAPVGTEVWFYGYDSWAEAEGAWITEWEWKVERVFFNESGSEIDREEVVPHFGPELPFVATEQGDYEISLRVKDNYGVWSTDETETTDTWAKWWFWAFLSEGTTELDSFIGNLPNLYDTVNWSFFAPEPGEYFIYWNDAWDGDETYSGDIAVDGYDGGVELFSDKDSAFTDPVIIYVDSSRWIDLTIEASYTAGDFRIWVEH